MPRVVINDAQLARTLAAAVDTDLHDRARAVERRAVQTAPVDTGDYARSIHTRPHPAVPGGYQVGSEIDYAAFLEHGTRRMRAYRTLGRALDAAKE